MNFLLLLLFVANLVMLLLPSLVFMNIDPFNVTVPATHSLTAQCSELMNYYHHFLEICADRFHEFQNLV